MCHKIESPQFCVYVLLGSPRGRAVARGLEMCVPDGSGARSSEASCGFSIHDVRTFFDSDSSREGFECAFVISLLG